MKLSLVLTFLVACGSITAKQPDAHVDTAASPALTTVTPPSGIVTTVVTLTGSNFGSTQGTVTIGGTTATVQSWTDTTVVAVVPDLHPGNADVVVMAAAGMAGPLPFKVVLPPAIYLNNDANDPTSGFDTITVMTFDPTTGAVTQLGQPVSIGRPTSGFGGCSSSIIVHVPTRRVFATASNGVGVFDIDPVTGALTAVPGSPFLFGTTTRAFGVVVNKAGTRAWAADFAGTLGVFDIAANGAMTPVVGSPFTVSASPDILALSTSETFLYANTEASNILGFSLAASGAPTALSGSPYAFTTGFGAGSRPGTDQLYFAGQSGNLGVWQPAAGTGIPAQIAGSPFVLAPPAGLINGVAFTSDGGRLYVGTYTSGHIFGFNLAADGTPTAIGGSPWNFTATFQDLTCLAVSADGHMIGVNEGHKQVGVFTLGADGTPTMVAGSPFTQTTPAENASGLAISF